MEHSGAESARFERADAVRELGAALRELSEAAVSTEVDTDTLLRTAEQARDLAAPLKSAQRTRKDLPSVDLPGLRKRMYNPVIGVGNPFSPPLDVEVVDGVAVGHCTLGLMHEGPPSYGHGGVSALILDQILGHAHEANRTAGMTVKLSVRYRRPVPLQTPLRVVGWVDDTPATTNATITTVADPDTVLVRAEGTFVTPNPAQARRLFGDTGMFTQQR